MLKEALMTALVAAYKAGEAINSVYDSADFEVELKEDKSPLTLADRSSHNVILKELAQFNNKYNCQLLSEEGKLFPYNERKDWQCFWLIDPLDGTKEFIKRNGEFTVNLALIHNGVLVIGVVYAPAMGCCYFACKNAGSFKLNSVEVIETRNNSWDILIKNSKQLPLLQSTNKPFTVVGSRSHGSESFDEFIQALRLKYGEIELMSAGSSLKLCLVAEGAANIYPRFGHTMEWDTAAGHCIVNEAGGTVVTIDTGKPLVYNKENLLNPWFIVKGGAPPQCH
ncbi:MAG: 3'(2'),5'-bisphosphate nucleotidase CysQ [Candidatus Magnetoovum sp. WYHC-5]|nr:3'(2'),5'-bisphosphate nucleotidase CysQ [Candidatus Magnetoovum sp. WYHC-5]